MSEKEDKKNQKDTDKEKDVVIDFEIGKLNFGGLLKGFGDLVDLASKLGKEGYEKSGSAKIGKRGRLVYGLTVNNLAGKTTFETFGNVKDTEQGRIAEDIREPIVDIFDEGKTIKVIAEVPGASENDIKIEISGDILNFTATGPDRKYAKELLLPGEVEEKVKETRFKNGILEIVVVRKTGLASGN